MSHNYILKLRSLSFSPIHFVHRIQMACMATLTHKSTSHAKTWKTTKVQFHQKLVKAMLTLLRYTCIQKLNKYVLQRRREESSRARSSEINYYLFACREMLCVMRDLIAYDFRKASNNPLHLSTLQLLDGYALFSRVDFVIQRTHNILQQKINFKLEWRHNHSLIQVFWL